MNVNERRKAILEVLCARRHETRENLAFEFGVSKRTIEYDVLSLSLEYPVYTSQGNGGGIHVVDGFKLDMKYLSDKQCSLLEKLAANLSGDDAEVMASIIKTFALPKNRRKKGNDNEANPDRSSGDPLLLCP